MANTDQGCYWMEKRAKIKNFRENPNMFLLLAFMYSINDNFLGVFKQNLLRTEVYGVDLIASYLVISNLQYQFQ